MKKIKYLWIGLALITMALSINLSGLVNRIKAQDSCQGTWLTITGNQKREWCDCSSPPPQAINSHIDASAGAGDYSVGVESGCSPFAWTISGSGTGFELSDSSATSRTNSVTAYPGAAGAIKVTVKDKCDRPVDIVFAASAYYHDYDYYETPYTGPYSRRQYHHRTVYNSAGIVIWAGYKSCVLGGTTPVNVRWDCTNVEGYTMCGASYCSPIECGTWGTWCYGSFGGAY